VVVAIVSVPPPPVVGLKTGLVLLAAPTPALLIARMLITYAVSLVRPVIVRGELVDPMAVHVEPESMEYS
jgi:hypothetical protein